MKGRVPLALFPSRVAKGGNFCNRVNEKQRIQSNIANIRHTLLISPRRYGKTSLVLQALHESKKTNTYIQFFNAFQDEIVLKRFVDGLRQLIAQLLPKTKKALLKFIELIRHTTTSLEWSGVNIEVGIKPLSKHPVDAIKELLCDVERILKEKNEYAVIFCDEFQDIVESDISDELQAMMRDFAQLTDHVTFIISGSHRHMLAQIFDDSNKPFYKLFDRIDLKRIQKHDYILFIQKLARDRWKSQLADNVLDEALNLTECHAYYVNRLCAKLWELETTPSLREVHRLWQQLVEEEFSSVANDLAGLTKNQRIVLQAIAKAESVQEPYSSVFLGAVGLASRSVGIALEALEKTDHIELLQGSYHVVDPVVKHILAQ